MARDARVLFPAILGSIFVLYIAHILSIAISIRMRTISWIKAPGQVTSLQTEALFGYTYECKVKYSFIVQGRHYNGSRAGVWGETGLQPLCSRLVRKQKMGALWIYHNPENPEENMTDNALHPLFVCLLLIVAFYEAFFASYAVFSEGYVKETNAWIFLMLFSAISGVIVLWAGIQGLQHFIFSSIFSLFLGLAYISFPILNAYEAFRHPHEQIV